MSEKGFHIVNHEPFPMREIKFGDKTISIEYLVKVAEKMRLELLEHGVSVQVQEVKK